MDEEHSSAATATVWSGFEDEISDSMEDDGEETQSCLKTWSWTIVS